MTDCFMVEYAPDDLCFYRLEDDDDYLGPVPRDEVPEEWGTISPALVMPDGTLVTCHGLPPGAMYDYMQSPVGGMKEAFGPRAVNGQYRVCVLPDGHHWQIDSRANNCTMPDDDEHRCWVRHGEPPNLTIDKGGNTCSAGSGSILSPGWHGFLRDGKLVVT